MSSSYYRLLVLGSKKIGKTQLCSFIAGGDFHNSYYPSTHAEHFYDCERQLEFIDLPGCDDRTLNSPPVVPDYLSNSQNGAPEPIEHLMKNFNDFRHDAVLSPILNVSLTSTTVPLSSSAFSSLQDVDFSTIDGVLIVYGDDILSVRMAKALRFALICNEFWRSKAIFLVKNRGHLSRPEFPYIKVNEPLNVLVQEDDTNAAAGRASSADARARSPSLAPGGKASSASGTSNSPPAGSTGQSSGSNASQTQSPTPSTSASQFLLNVDLIFRDEIPVENDENFHLYYNIFYLKAVNALSGEQIHPVNDFIAMILTKWKIENIRQKRKNNINAILMNEEKTNTKDSNASDLGGDPMNGLNEISTNPKSMRSEVLKRNPRYLNRDLRERSATLVTTNKDSRTFCSTENCIIT